MHPNPSPSFNPKQKANLVNLNLENKHLRVKIKSRLISISILSKVVVTILSDKVIVIRNKKVVLSLASSRDHRKTLPLLIQQSISIVVRASVKKSKLSKLRVVVDVKEAAVLSRLDRGVEDTAGSVGVGVTVVLSDEVGGFGDGEDIDVAVDGFSGGLATSGVSVTGDDHEATFSEGQDGGLGGGEFLAGGGSVLRKGDGPLSGKSRVLSILVKLVLQQSGVTGGFVGGTTVVDGSRLEEGVESVLILSISETLETLVVGTAGSRVLRRGNKSRIKTGRVVGTEVFLSVTDGDQGVGGTDGLGHLSLLVKVVEEGSVLVGNPESLLVGDTVNNETFGVESNTDSAGSLTTESVAGEGGGGHSGEAGVLEDGVGVQSGDGVSSGVSKEDGVPVPVLNIGGGDGSVGGGEGQGKLVNAGLVGSGSLSVPDQPISL